MNRPVFLTSPKIAAGPMSLVGLRLMESVSMRPKTVSLPVLALGGLGIFYGMKLLPPKEAKDESKQKREYLLWDFFDPQGHHQIHWN